MKRSFALLSVAGALLSAASPAAAQIHTLEPEDPNRERRVYTSRIMREFGHLMEEWRGAWNSDDARAVSHLYTDDAALLLAATSAPARGRGEIEKALSGLLACSGEIRTGVEDFRVNGEMAYALGRYYVDDASAGAAAEGTYMLVLENRGRRWLIRSHMLRPDAAPGGTPPACGAPAQGGDGTG